MFEAIKYEPGRIEGRFSSGIIDCGGEGNICALALCCEMVAYGVVMEKLSLNWLGIRVPTADARNTYNIVAFMWLVFLFLQQYGDHDLQYPYRLPPSQIRLDLSYIYF